MESEILKAEWKMAIIRARCAMCDFGVKSEAATVACDAVAAAYRAYVAVAGIPDGKV